jgi:hypothetical protein
LALLAIIRLWLERLARDKHSSLFGLVISDVENNLLQVGSEPSTAKHLQAFGRLRALHRPGWKGLLGTNALAYLALSSAMKKKEVL